ncbi:hypothetical protein [Bacillus sp. FJAT-27251]|uniref:hypothetical protein n=1 Tax=Bacillus sp. FJAT-27251 TaxID=1684142 RepID=UPI0006A76CCF|nr:hypothetical protein [Bacillus sp. FJAT-27251]
MIVFCGVKERGRAEKIASTGLIGAKRERPGIQNCANNAYWRKKEEIESGKLRQQRLLAKKGEAWREKMRQQRLLT